ncbi:hypothetical protein CGCSCA5_v014755 [Colletotrichum siamense]|nr:hypothetical protein CGCSCA5_v014755 [Colletotrichum siamense]
MLEKTNILNWISQLPTPSTAFPEPTQCILNDRETRKRKRSLDSHSPQRIPSPPFSPPERFIKGMMDNQESSIHPAVPYTENDPQASVDEDGAEQGLEPESNNEAGLHNAALRVVDAEIGSVVSTSQVTEHTTPTSTKRKRQSWSRVNANIMAIEDTLQYQSFDGEQAPPPSLNRLRKHIQVLGRGIGIVSHAEKLSLKNEALTNNQFSWVDEGTFAPKPDATPKTPSLPPHRDALGPTPSIDYVREIWAAAFDAELVGHEESHWNLTVQGPILLSALKHLRNLGVSCW